MNQGNKILLVLCIIGLAAGTFIYFEGLKYRKNSKIAEGTFIHSLSSSYKIRYLDEDGNEYIKQGSSGKTKRYALNEVVNVYYRKDNPAKARLTDTVRTGRSVILISIALLLFDLYLIYTNNRREKLANHSKSTGRKIQAEITGVVVDMNTTIMEKHPWLIHCRWVDPMTGKEYNHTVDQVWKDPTPYLAGRQYLDVYINRDNPEEYYLDIEFMKEISP